MTELMNDPSIPSPPKAHLSDDQLVLVYYGEPLDPQDAALADHAATCAPCAARLGSLRLVLEAMKDDDIPEPSADFETRMAQSVLQRAATEDASPRVVPFRPRASRVMRVLAATAALAACLVLAFTFGRRFGREEEHALTAEQTRERILLTALGEHLGRSRVTLVEIKNRDVSAEDLRELQAAADNLVNASRLFRAAAERAGETQIAGVMEETERLLVRFAAAPSADAKAELAGLRKRVDSRDILFRLQVMETQVEKRGRELTASDRTAL